jgi:hypothetical protein
MLTHARSRRQTTYTTTFGALALAAVCGLGAGCGGSDGGGPTDAFVGRWLKAVDIPSVSDPSASGFGLTCTDPNFVDFTLSSFLVWNQMIFEHGVTSDLIETSGNCNSLSWNIDSSRKAATVPNPDPVLPVDPETGEMIPSGCIVELSYEDATGMILPAVMQILPPTGDNWKFTLLGTKNAAGAQQAQLIGSAPVDMALLNAQNMVISTATPCTYAGMDTFFRLTQP